MTDMFSGCCLLKKMSDITKRNLAKIKNIDWMFADCSRLKKLPDISKSNLNKNIKVDNIFN